MLIDRYILKRFFVNFVILFMLLFLFAATIDVAIALDRFVEAAKARCGEESGFFTIAATVVQFGVGFESPRLFQFYAYLHGLVAVGAMGFTLAQMHRHRELVAILSAGVSLHRVALPFVLAVFVLSLLQLVNTELFLPRVAPRLLREHRDVGRLTINDFPVPFTPDGAGNLFQSPAFDPHRRALVSPTIIERDERGRTSRRISADEAVWQAAGPEAGGEPEGWALDGGRSVTIEIDEERGSATQQSGAIDFYPTDLSPDVLTVRRYGQFASMLSLGQIRQMLATPGVAEQERLRNDLSRSRFARFSMVFVNVLVMWLTLPAFLLRRPANLLLHTVFCAALAIPALLGAAIFMTMDLPGIVPSVGVFLPVVFLVPLVLARWTYVET